MREQFKRLISAAAALSMLPGIAAAPYTGVSAYAVTVSAAAASAAQYGQSAAFAARVQSIEDGACGLYADRNGTLPEESLAVGTYMNKQRLYYVSTATGQSWNGKQCYIYAQGVYSMLFDALPLNGTASTAEARVVLQGPAEITPEVLREARVMPGAYLRTTPDTENGTFNGNAGHSLIILGYDDRQITVLEGNADGYGLIREATMSYEEFAHQFTTGWGRTVTHIIQPDESVYIARYGMTYASVPSAPAVTTAYTAPTTVTTTTTTTTTAATTVTTVTTTAATTTAATTTTAAATTIAATTTAATTTIAATTFTAVPETSAPMLSAFYSETPLSQPLASAAVLPDTDQGALLTPTVYTADPILITRKTTQIALFLPESKSFSWSSSAPDIVLVDESGRVTVRSNGEALITAERGNMRYEFPVSVRIVGWAALGDINFDGIVDPTDAALALSVYVDGLVGSGKTADMTADQLSRADVDDSGAISIEDAQNILRFYVEYTLSGSGKSPMETWARLLSLE